MISMPFKAMLQFITGIL